MADVITFRVTAAGSRGRLTVVEIAVPVNGGPPPLHIHPPDEVFYVIEGEVTVFKGPPGESTRSVLRVGETDHVPGGTPHTFRNFSDQAALLLLTFAPGVMMERFFVEAGHALEGPARVPQLDFDAEVARVFGIGSGLGMETLAPPE
jgi:mannose-6-phosphate isomerase-like protein (cupin superfamily)